MKTGLEGTRVEAETPQGMLQLTKHWMMGAWEGPMAVEVKGRGWRVDIWRRIDMGMRGMRETNQAPNL